MTVFKCFYCGHKTASAIGLHKHEKQCAGYLAAWKGN